MLAVRVIQEQGIEVTGVNFFTGFCVEGHTQAIRSRDGAKPKRNNALWVAATLGIKLHFLDVVEDYKDVVLNPKHGYGANMNPCLDCKIFMVEKAREWMREHNHDFMITGEVIGQRPMSQRKHALPKIQAEAGIGNLLLRPLSAKLLPPTQPEIDGLVDRERLYGFNGRSRKPQIELARSFGIDDYAQPAGGCCFLTDPNYSNKLRDLWANRPRRSYELDDIILLKVGRHFRPNERFKLIVSREEGEGRFMHGYRNQLRLLEMKSHAGPSALIDGDPTEEDLILAARLVARYSQGRNEDQVQLSLDAGTPEQRTMSVQPFRPDEVPKAWQL